MILGPRENFSYDELSMRMELAGAVPIPERTYNAISYRGNPTSEAKGWIARRLSDGRFSVRLGDHRSYVEDFVWFCLENGYCVPARVLEGIGTLSIQDGVDDIGDYAFCGCSELTSVTIPSSVTSIGEGAFSYCTNLMGVTIGNSVTSIGERAFYNCIGLTSVTIPDSVLNIWNYAFYNCRGLTSVTIGNGVTSIGFSAFRDCRGLERVTTPDSVTRIGVYAFTNCQNLKKVFVKGCVDHVRRLYPWGSGVEFEEVWG